MDQIRRATDILNTFSSHSGNFHGLIEEIEEMAGRDFTRSVTQLYAAPVVLNLSWQMLL